MSQKLVSALPESLKENLRTASELIPRLKKRRLGLVNFSPQKAARIAFRAPAASPNALANFASRIEKSALADRGVSIHNDVIAYPMMQEPAGDRLGEYFQGGLADRNTGTLLAEANHYNGVTYAQKLTDAYKAQFSLDGCAEIQRPVMYGGLLFNHFAHFLVESIYRLHAYPLLKELDPYILYHPVWGTVNYLERRNFAHQVFEGFGIPVEKLVVAKRVVRIKELAVPAQKYGYGFLHKPDPTWLEFVKSFQFPKAVPSGFENADKVYVARSGLRKQGTQVGEKQFEEYLANAGYKVFYPENYSLFEQLTVYSRANKLIFAEGGAIQSCVLLPDLQAEVAVICRRRDARRNIPVATACLQGYGKSIVWIDRVQGQFQFGLETWEMLTDIDWAAVSDELKRQGFVQNSFQGLSEQEHAAQLKSELRAFLQEVSGDPRFVNTSGMNQSVPAWQGPSHLLDPRDGRPIWCSTGDEEAAETKTTNA